MESFRKLAEKMERNDWVVDSSEKGLAKMETENFALISERNYYDQYLDRLCDLKQVGPPLVTIFYGMGMQKSRKID